MLDITREIVNEQGYSVKIAVVRSSQEPAAIVAAFDEKRISPLPNAPEIDKEVIASCTNIVALAGTEQIAAALDTGADIIIAGRTTDTAIIAALPIQRGCHSGSAWHGAKIGECGALCATNPQSGVILIDFDHEAFTVRPLADGAQATPHTVSAHMLYENSDPFILYEPGGYLDVSDAKYVALDDTSVRVSGSKWVPSKSYTVKLEGARSAGFQTVILALLRDEHYVSNAEVWAADIVQKCTAKALERLDICSSEFTIEIRLIGQTASFGALETKQVTPTEVGAIAIVTAGTENLATEIAKLLNPYLLHHPLTADEEVPTFAFLFSPPEMPRGEIYEFSLNHVLQLDNPMDAFKIEVLELG
jgi:hypothetical protein